MSFFERIKEIIFGLDGKNYRAYTKEFDRVISGEEASQWPETPSTESVPPLSQIPANTKPLVTVLVDHSGSMRGRPVIAVVDACQAIGDHLDSQGLPYEILGFTTSSWHGGKSGDKWKTVGGPIPPGRVCDLLHIVYRDCTRPDPKWLEKLSIAFKTRKILKENIDGEALLWAQERANSLNSSHWVLLVIGDGAPSDASTLILNGQKSMPPAEGQEYIRPDNLLTKHLSYVVDSLEASPNVTIGSLGIRYAVEQTYTISRTVFDMDQSSSLAQELLKELLERVSQKA